MEKWSTTTIPIAKSLMILIGLEQHPIYKHPYKNNSSLPSNQKTKQKDDWSRGRFLYDLQILLIAIIIIDDSDGEWAAGALGDGPALFDIHQWNLELVAAGTGVVEGLIFGLEIEVFDLDLVVHLVRHVLL